MKRKDEYNLALDEISKQKPEIVKVKKLLYKAMNKGNPQAAYALGTWYLHGKYFRKNTKEAIRLLRQASYNNVSEALYDMAVCYEKGVGVKKNYKLAFENYVKSALYGDKQSHYEVGRCYYYGIGIKKNRKLSIIWLDKAETLGITD